MNQYIILVLIFCFTILGGLQSKAQKTENERESIPVYQNDTKLEWFRDAKFGLFMHWGPSSVRGTEIGWSRYSHPFDHGDGTGIVPDEEYDNLYKNFNPVKFDAEAWMKLAKKACLLYTSPSPRDRG